MKPFFFNITLVCAFIYGINVNAQDIQLATLQQGDDLQVFYGAGAFRDAHSAAATGDLITLSAGTFNETTITKALIIQGAGYVTDVENGKYPTIISGSTINLTDEGLIIEGIFFSGNVDNRNVLSSAIFKRCRFPGLNLLSYGGTTKNCLIEHCRFSGTIYIDNYAENLGIKNSIINVLGSNNSSATVLVENCIVINGSPTAVYRNNIINASLTSSSSAAYNNVFTYGNANSVLSKDGNMTSDADSMFGYTIAYDDNKTYELTPEALSEYIGTDGTQVGIYGGDRPFTHVPSNPQIIKKQIDGKSSPEGKLKVNITVEAQN